MLSNDAIMLVTENEALQFITRCLVSAGAGKQAAEEMAKLLVAADLAGHHSHGMNRLEFYVNDLVKGYINTTTTPEILKETPATAWVDGHGALGATVGHFCMDLAINKAKEVGIGFISVKGSSHYGMAGYWAQKAEREGMIGMSFTNTSPVVVPTRGTKQALGTNPLAISAPGQQGDSFLLDMATSAVALGKIEMKRRRAEALPLGWALDNEGRQTTDPDVGLRSQKLLPLGGLEETSGYKGYGLSMAVETLCGILSGANYGCHINRWANTDGPQNLGQCFLAIDVGYFAPGFNERMSDLMGHIRTSPQIDPNQEILIPGDRRRKHLQSIKQRGYIGYGEDQLKSCQILAEQLNVEPIRWTSETSL